MARDLGGGRGGYTRDLQGAAQRAASRVDDDSKRRRGGSPGGMGFVAIRPGNWVSKMLKGPAQEPFRDTPVTGRGSGDGNRTGREGQVDDRPFPKTQARAASPAAAAAPATQPLRKPAAPPAIARQGLLSPERTMLERFLRERAIAGGAGRTTVLNELYGLPDDPAVASRSLQAFNTRLGSRTVLGRRG